MVFSRDHRFISRSAMLPTLFELTSLKTLNHARSVWSESAAALLRFTIRHRAQCDRLSKWHLWPLSTLSSTYSAVKTGALSYRQLLLKVLTAPSSLVSLSLLANLGLTADLLTGSHGLTDVSKILLGYELVLRASRLKDQREREVVEQRKSLISKAVDMAYNDLLEKFIHLKLPVFDSKKKNEAIDLSCANTCAAIKSFNKDDTAATVFCSICYDLTVGPMNTGNYFELEVKTGLLRLDCFKH